MTIKESAQSAITLMPLTVDPVEQFKAGYEIGAKDIISKACKWIECNMLKFTWDDYETDPEAFADALRKAMEE